MSRYIPACTCPNVVARNIYAVNHSTGLSVDGVTCKTGGVVLVADGAAGTPSLYFSASNGLYLPSTSTLGLCTGGSSRLSIADSSATLDSSILTTTFDATTASSNTSTGALVVYGGVGVGSDLFVGGSLVAPSLSYTKLGAGDTLTTGFSFTNDTDTSIYRVGPNQLGFATANANRLTLTDSSATFASSISTIVVNCDNVSSSTSTGAIVTAGNVSVSLDMNVSGNVTAQVVSSPNIIAADQGSVAFGFSGSTSGVRFQSSYYYPDLYSDSQCVLSVDPTNGSTQVGYGSTYNSRSYCTVIGSSATPGLQDHITVVGTGAYAPNNNDNQFTQNVIIGKGALTNSTLWSVAVGSGAVMQSGNYKYFMVQIGGGWSGAVGHEYGTNLGTASSRVANGVTLSCAGSATWLTYGQTSWSSTSDERLKNINSDLTVGMDLIRTIQPVTFKWKDSRSGPGRTHQGFTYQRLLANLSAAGYDEHEAIMSEEITEKDGSKSTMGNVAPGGLIPHIVRAIEELVARSAQIAARLRNKISS